MKKMTFDEICERFAHHNLSHNVTSQFDDDERLTAVVVFKSENWPDKDYSLESRSYRFTSDNKYFISGMGGNSIFANSLDKSDTGIRLDWYLQEWDVDYCYMEGE